MYGGQLIGVVVPAYNEDRFVDDVIQTVPEFVDRVYVVDDCSADNTWATIQSTLDEEDASTEERPTNRPDWGPGMAPIDRIQTGNVATSSGEDEDGPGFVGGASGESEPPGAVAFQDRIVAIHHADNAGVGGAIKTGYRHALADGIDVTAVMSGDGQMEPAILHRVVHPVVAGDAEYAKGDRLRYAKYREQMSGWRTFGNYLLTYLTRIASGYWQVMDPQNGYTAISSRALEAIDLEALYDDYGFCNDLLVRLNANGLRITDIPMRAVYGDESSHIRYSRFVPALSLLLLRSYVRRLTHPNLYRETRATVAFQLLGVACVVLGGGLAISSLVPGIGSTLSLPTVGVVSLAGVGLFLAGVATDRRRGAGLVTSSDPAESPNESDIDSSVLSSSEDTADGG